MRGAICSSLIAALAGVLIGGCGGDGDEPLSKPEYLAQGNKICKKFLNQTDAIAAQTLPKKGQPNPAQLSEFAGKISPVIEDGIASLRELNPPEGDEQRVEAIYSAADDAIAKYERAAKDPKAAPAIFNSDPPGRAQKLADEYGLTECGENR